MKKRLLVSVALGIGAFALAGGVAMAGSAPGSGIIGSLHDLSDDGGYPVTGTNGNPNDDKLSRVCIYCHAPHHTQKADKNSAKKNYMPLWNRPISQAQTFVMYSNGSNPGTGSHMSQAMSDFAANNIQSPGAVSLLCLSCHDGTVAPNVYGSQQMSNASWSDADNDRVNPIGSIGVKSYDLADNTAYQGSAVRLQAGTEYNIGGTSDATVVDLSNHHPIGFDYTFVEANDHEIATTDTQFGTTGVTIGDVLYGDQMECVTCHDVHNSTQGMGEKFLWTSNKDSAFCCTCHLKCNNPK